MRRPRKLAAAVTVMVLAACGGGGGGAATPDGTDDATDVTSNETTPESSSAEGESMADFFGYGEEDQEAAQADYRDQEGGPDPRGDPPLHGRGRVRVSADGPAGRGLLGL